MHRWANSRQKRLKNPNDTSEEPRAKGGQGQKQGTAQAPCTQHHTRRRQAPKPLLWPKLVTLLPSLHIKNKRGPTQGMSKGTLVCSHSHCCSRGSNKALLEFLVWPLINFYWLRRPITLAGNTTFKASPLEELSNFFILI